MRWISDTIVQLLLNCSEREFPSSEMKGVSSGRGLRKKGKTVSLDTTVASLRRLSRHVQKAAACVSQEARWSQDRNVGFVDIWIKEFIKKLSTQGKESQGLIPGGRMSRAGRWALRQRRKRQRDPRQMKKVVGALDGKEKHVERR